jgi:hypothetical protein
LQQLMYPRRMWKSKMQVGSCCWRLQSWFRKKYHIWWEMRWGIQLVLWEGTRLRAW